ncbi:hypothetical protein ES702_06249 [subsurface metagenome]
MKVIIADLANWPRTKNGQPILKCTEEANFYASLIYANEKEIKLIRKAMENARQNLHAMRETPSKDLNKMMHLAVKAQFYRECLEELDRIHNNKFFA